MTLLEKLCNRDFLYQAWLLLNRDNVDSYGFSRLSIADFEKNLEENLFEISKELRAGIFKFSKLRAAVIPKPNGKFRPLQISEIRDRVVLKGMALIIEEEFSQILIQNESVSFAYQKGRGVREAILRMKYLFINNKSSYILKADIVNFFEEVNKDVLIKKKLLPKLQDRSINPLIDAAFSQKLIGVKWLKEEHWELFKNAGKGIPQGNPISPLLSNIYLSDFDEFCKSEGLSLIRYADDLLFICKSKQDALDTFEMVSNFLSSKYSLKIHPLGNNGDKTLILEPVVGNELNFLGIDFDGKNVRPDKRCHGGLLRGIKEIVKSFDNQDRAKDEISNLLNKWISVFSYSDIEAYFDQIDNYIFKLYFKKFKVSFPKKYQCKKLAFKVRNRQRAQSKNSFWHKVELKFILPAVHWVKNWKLYKST